MTAVLAVACALIAVVVVVCAYQLGSRRRTDRSSTSERRTASAVEARSALIPTIRDSETTYRVSDPDSPDRELLVKFIPADMVQLSAAARRSSASDPAPSTAMRNAFDGLVHSIPAAGALLESGMAMRVVGPPEVIAGLANETLKAVTSDGHTLGVVKDVVSGKFAGQMQFGKVGVTPANAALGVFAVMSVVTGQYYMHRIDRSLNALRADVDAIRQHQASEVFGKVEAAAKLNEQVRKNLLDGIPPGQSDFSDLDHAEQLILQAYGSTRKRLADFLQRVGNRRKPEEFQKDELLKLWEQASSHVLEDADLLVFAAFVRNENNLLALAIEPQGDSRRAENILERIDEERDAMLEDMKTVRDIYSRLQMSEKELSQRFFVSGKVEQAASRFDGDTKQITGLVSAPEHKLLPAPPKVDMPFMTEIWTGSNGELQMASAVLTPGD